MADEADRQLYDEAQIRRELLQLELDHEDGLIEDEERVEQEDALLERLAVAKRRAQEEHMPAATETGGYPMTEESIDG